MNRHCLAGFTFFEGLSLLQIHPSQQVLEARVVAEGADKKAAISVGLASSWTNEITADKDPTTSQGLKISAIATI